MSLKARAGEIKGFTGIDQPYEVPSNPELEVRTDQETEKESVHRVVTLLRERVSIPFKVDIGPNHSPTDWKQFSSTSCIPENPA